MRYAISVDYNEEYIRVATLKEVFDMLRLLSSNSIFRIGVYRIHQHRGPELFIEKTASYISLDYSMTINKAILFEEEMENL